MKALISGVEQVFDGHWSSLAYLNWEQIENRACGEKTVDIAALKSITTYNESEEKDIFKRFWRVFEDMFTEE